MLTSRDAMDENFWFRMLDLNGGRAYKERIGAVSRILLDTRGYVFEIPREETVIVLFSGGMDSTTLIDLVAHKWKCKMVLLFFRRDAKNGEWEEKSVDFFHNFYKTRYPDQILELLKLDIQIPTRVNKEYMDKNRKRIMGLPMRNATMWNVAATQAVYLSGKYGTTVRTILTGSVGEDRDSPESGYLSVLSQNLHACICLGVWNYQYGAPLMDGSFKPGGMFKKDLVDYCKANAIPIEKTRSCFGDSETPCGHCLACEYRMAAFSTPR